MVIHLQEKPQPFFENSFRGQTSTVYLLFWPVGALQRSVYKAGNNGQVLTKQGNNFIDLFHFVAPDNACHQHILYM